MIGSATPDAWLSRFHAGDREVLEACYDEEYDTVLRAVGRVLSGADQETVVHEVFFRLLTDGEFRARFEGRALGSWLAVVARNQAIDYARRRARECPESERPKEEGVESFSEAVEARVIIERFRRDVLPPKWRETFDLRLLQQLDQKEVARRLGISRATVAYRELRIDALLRRHLLRTEVT